MTNDIADELPKIALPVNWVTLIDRDIYLGIEDSFSSPNKVEKLLCKIKSGISLPKNKRGIHTSRIEKLIFESSFKNYRNLREYAINLSHSIFESQDCNSSYVEIESINLRNVKTNKTNLDTQQKLIAAYKNIYNGKKDYGQMKLVIPIFTACPACMRTLQDIDKSVGFATHSQKAFVTVEISKVDDKIKYLSILKSIENVAECVPHMLKRFDEGELVLKTLKRPKYVEDIVRELICDLYKRFKNILKSDSILRIKINSQESIHPHNMSAEIISTIENLNKHLRT